MAKDINKIIFFFSWNGGERIAKEIGAESPLCDIKANTRAMHDGTDSYHCHVIVLTAWGVPVEVRRDPSSEKKLVSTSLTGVPVATNSGVNLVRTESGT